jgi:hypothetical protein
MVIKQTGSLPPCPPGSPGPHTQAEPPLSIPRQSKVTLEASGGKWACGTASSAS